MRERVSEGMCNEGVCNERVCNEGVLPVHLPEDKSQIGLSLNHEHPSLSIHSEIAKKS